MTDSSLARFRLSIAPHVTTRYCAPAFILLRHGPNKGDVFDSYTTLPWEALCAEVSKLRINLSGSDVLAGRASSEIATSSETVHPRGDGETVTRTVTFAVTVPGASRGSVVQIHKTPQDFSRGDLRGGRDLNPWPPA